MTLSGNRGENLAGSVAPAEATQCKFYNWLFGCLGQINTKSPLQETRICFPWCLTNLYTEQLTFRFLISFGWIWLLRCGSVYDLTTCLQLTCYWLESHTQEHNLSGGGITFWEGNIVIHNSHFTVWKCLTVWKLEWGLCLISCWKLHNEWMERMEVKISQKSVWNL